MTDKALRIGFMGTPDFAAHALKALVEAGHNIVCVYSQPPRPKGRGHKLQPSPVHHYADEQGIEVFHPQSLKPKDVQDEFAAHNLDIAVVAAYGLILPKPVLDAPKYGCINIHASLLPRWRGASPIQRAIWAGDTESGVTIMQMDEGLDTGPEILKTAIPLTNDETATTLHDKLADLGAKMTLDVLEQLAKNGQITHKEQEKDGVTYAHLLKKEDGKINWDQSAAQIDRQIRALTPWPGVWCDHNGNRLKILAATSAPAPDGQGKATAGTLLDKHGHIACAENSTLQIKSLQPAGKKPMDTASAINGGYMNIGDTLS